MNIETPPEKYHNEFIKFISENKSENVELDTFNRILKNGRIEDKMMMLAGKSNLENLYNKYNQYLSNLK